MDLRDRLCLPNWDSLTSSEAEATAREIERAVPGARFSRLEEHAMGDQRHRVAVFEVDGLDMVLVPGARRELGFHAPMLDASPPKPKKKPAKKTKKKR